MGVDENRQIVLSPISLVSSQAAGSSRVSASKSDTPDTS